MRRVGGWAAGADGVISLRVGQEHTQLSQADAHARRTEGALRTACKRQLSDAGGGQGRGGGGGGGGGGARTLQGLGKGMGEA